MRIEDFPRIDDNRLAAALAPGMECRGKGVLFVIWWPRHGLYVVFPRREASHENICIAVKSLKKAAGLFS